MFEQFLENVLKRTRVRIRMTVVALHWDLVIPWRHTIQLSIVCMPVERGIFFLFGMPEQRQLLFCSCGAQAAAPFR